MRASLIIHLAGGIASLQFQEEIFLRIEFRAQWKVKDRNPVSIGCLLGTSVHTLRICTSFSDVTSVCFITLAVSGCVVVHITVLIDVFLRCNDVCLSCVVLSLVDRVFLRYIILFETFFCLCFVVVFLGGRVLSGDVVFDRVTVDLLFSDGNRRGETLHDANMGYGA